MKDPLDFARHLAVVAMLALFAAPAFSAEVYSSNIVGYSKVSIDTEFTMIGAQFANVGGTVKDINDLFAANDLPGLDEEGEFQTTILSWNGIGYDIYGWMNATDGTDNEMPEWDSKWVLFDFSDLAEVPMPVGEAFWLRSSGTGSVTIAGEIDESDPAPVEISREFTMIANPLPKALDVQKVVPSESLPGLDEQGEFQTTLLVWNGVGYDIYGWMNATDGTDNEMPEWDSKWVLFDFSDLASQSLDIGQAAWLRTKAGATGTITFEK